jgi:hypothetical protein
MRFARSAQLLERSRKFLAGGVSSDVRKAELPHPLFFALGKGSHIWDVDGNEFIDYVLGQGPLLLGHSPQPVLEAVTGQLQRGLIYAAQHEAELELAQILLSNVLAIHNTRNLIRSAVIGCWWRISTDVKYLDSGGRWTCFKIDGHWFLNRQCGNSILVPWCLINGRCQPCNLEVLCKS